MTQTSRLILNDRQGLLADTFAAEGERVYAYHESHPEDLSVCFSPDWKAGGIVYKYGDPFEGLVRLLVQFEEGKTINFLHVLTRKTHTPDVEYLKQMKIMYDDGLMDNKTQIIIV